MLGSWLFSSNPCNLPSCETWTHPGAHICGMCDGLLTWPRKRVQHEAHPVRQCGTPPHSARQYIPSPTPPANVAPSPLTCAAPVRVSRHPTSAELLGNMGKKSLTRRGR